MKLDALVKVFIENRKLKFSCIKIENSLQTIGAMKNPFHIVIIKLKDKIRQ